MMQRTLPQVNQNNHKTTWIELRIAPISTVFARFGSQRLLAVRRPEKILTGKNFPRNEEVFAETEAHFEAKDKSFYKSGIEMLERLWNDCVALDGDYVDE